MKFAIPPVLFAFLILAGISLPAIVSSQARRPVLWFEGARLIIGDKSPAIESSAFLVEGDSFTWVGKKGERQPPANAVRVDLTGKTVMPSIVDAHKHLAVTREALLDQLQHLAYYGVGTAMSRFSTLPTE